MKRDLSVPRHVAIVMDGNGRWAKKRFLPRFFGHKAGVDALVRVINACADRGIEYLTVMVGAYGLGEVLVRLEQGFDTKAPQAGEKIATRFPSPRQIWEIRGTLARSSVLGIVPGLIPGAGGTQRLSRLIGAAKSKLMIFMGDQIDAVTALHWGLINKVVPPEKVMEEATDWAQKLAAKSSPVLAAAKMAINTGLDTNLGSGLSIETKCNAVCFSTYDRKEGMDAFLEKRKAVFKNK